MSCFGDSTVRQWPFVYDEDDEGGTVWHESGRAARWTVEENGNLSLTLFFGDDPWVTAAHVDAVTEEDALKIVKQWCEDHDLP